jgi:alkylated DNA repair dioxygenase AlkB
MTSIDFKAMMRAEQNRLIKERSMKKSNNIFHESVKRMEEEPFVLDKYCLCPLLDGERNQCIYYIPEFITEEEERNLIKEIYATDIGNMEENGSKWVNLRNRRLKNLGGVPHTDGIIQVEMPKYVTDFKQLLTKCNLNVNRFISTDSSTNCSYNQVLLNEYSYGKGISDHKDGPLYESVALVLSLQSGALLHFSRGSNNTGDYTIEHTVYLQPRSLLIFGDKFYEELKHGIMDAKEDHIAENCLNMHLTSLSPGDTLPRGDKRLSLTIRCCKMVQKTLEDRTYSKTELAELTRRAQWWYHSINDQ